MATIELVGLHIVKAKRKGKPDKVYVYAWRGGPRVKAELGSPEFTAEYNKAVDSKRIPDKKAFQSVITRYKASNAYLDLAESTKRNWRPWLDRISDYFGKLRTAQFDRADKIRPLIRKWRGKYAETPRTADYGMQVLSRILAYAVDPLGEIDSNPCEGIKQLYSGSRAGIIWTDDDIAILKKTCSEEVAHAIDLAAYTGLRVGDLVKLSWSHVGSDAIIMGTGKSGGKRQAIVPLYEELRNVLARIPRRSTTVLTSSRNRPWTTNGLASSFHTAKREAWPEGDTLHFHDLRGTAATKFYLAGLSEREIAETMGWEEDYVSKIIRRYVSRSAAIEDRIRRLDEARNKG